MNLRVSLLGLRVFLNIIENAEGICILCIVIVARNALDAGTHKHNLITSSCDDNTGIATPVGWGRRPVGTRRVLN